MKNTTMILALATVLAVPTFAMAAGTGAPAVDSSTGVDSDGSGTPHKARGTTQYAPDQHMNGSEGINGSATTDESVDSPVSPGGDGPNRQILNNSTSGSGMKNPNNATSR